MTILISAYAVNPYKGSEDGMGWNFILQAAKENKVLAVTRKNNKPFIDQYFNEHPELLHYKQNIAWQYFDWPKWMLAWKKGPLLSMIYYYFWQLTLALKLMMQAPPVDVVHNLNFHNDWTPSFLWLLGKPFIWGPVGHHPKLPRHLLPANTSLKTILMDRLLWLIKCWFWYCDPFLYITKKKADHIICMNTEAARKLRLREGQYSILPSVGCETPAISSNTREGFTVLSAGRFVPLKGFDLTIKSFAKFYRNLATKEQEGVSLVLIGSGPMKAQMQLWLKEEGIEHCTKIISWMPRHELMQVYQGASAFLFPSHEGAGMVVAEAMSYGLPVVCLDNSGPGEFLHPQSRLGAGVISYKECVAELSLSLDALHANASYYRTESEWSLKRFDTYFNWQAKGNQLRNIYRQLEKDVLLISKSEALA